MRIKQHNPQDADLSRSPMSLAIGWLVPIGILVAGGYLDLESFSYPVGLGWIGAACIVNALHCGRTHCYITGPYFLILAGLSVVYATAGVPFGAQGWIWIGGGAILGGVVLTCFPDMIWGKYVRRDQ